MSINDRISQSLPYLNKDLIYEILSVSEIHKIEKDTVILREGQYVKVIPIVLNGLIKVFTSHKDKELLLYYIKPSESCVMSFSASLKNEPSSVFALTEEDSEVLLLPVDYVSKWVKIFPEMNTLFFQQYNLRYSELLETIHHVLFDKMDKRLYDFLLERKILTNKNPLKISHRQIATELGTAREVISRVMKKLETEGKLKQNTNSIDVF